MTDKEALKLALEALENVESAMYVTSEGEAVALEKVNKAIAAIKEALAQPVQPAQRPWVGLTDEDYLDALDSHPYEGTDRELWLVLEAKLKEKNT